MMRFVDTFLFSEPREADVLWVKLNVESHLIDEWVVVENSHTHQGQYKGHSLNKLLHSDVRFAPFLPKVQVIECDVRPGFQVGERKVFDEDAVQIERAQRESAVPYLLYNYSDDAYVLISDVDECLETEAPKRRRLLMRKAAAGGDVVLVPRLRYWFDYDNRGLQRRCVPMVTVRQIRRDGRLNHYREQWISRPVIWKHEMVFEYTYCYSRAQIVRKFDTFIHTGFEAADLDPALRHNHRPLSKHRSRQLGWNYESWFVKRRLTSRNSPDFVRKHLAELKTNIVSPEYHHNRIEEFPQFFPKSRVARVRNWVVLYGRMTADLLEENSRDYVTMIEKSKSFRRRVRRLVLWHRRST